MNISIDNGSDETEVADPGNNANPPAATLSCITAKGTCWYCDKTLDNVKHFCGKACSKDFDTAREFEEARGNLQPLGTDDTAPKLRFPPI